MKTSYGSGKGIARLPLKTTGVLMKQVSTALRSPSSNSNDTQKLWKNVSPKKYSWNFRWAVQLHVVTSDSVSMTICSVVYCRTILNNVCERSCSLQEHVPPSILSR